MQNSSPSTRHPRRLTVFIASFVGVAACLCGLVFWKIARIDAMIAAHAFTPPPIEVSAITVAPTRLPSSLKSIGTLYAIQAVDVSPMVSGRIVDIEFQANQKVTKGTRLLQLDDKLEQAGLKAAMAKLQYARQQLERSRMLSLTQTEPKQILDQKQSEYDQAMASVEQLTTQINYKSVQAPFSGILGLREVNLGQYINAGTKVTTLTALDKLHVNFTLPQQDLPQIMIGASAIVRSDAFPGYDFPATITAIEPSIDPNTRNAIVQATLPNPDESLHPGLFVTVEIILSDRENVIAVPLTAIQASASGDMVYLVKDDKAELIPVKTGPRNNERVIIEGGVSPGDTLITTGQLRVYPGARVSISPNQDQNGSAGGVQ